MKPKTYRKTGRLPMAEFSRKQVAEWLKIKKAEFGRPQLTHYLDARVYWWPEHGSSVYQYVVMAH